MKTLEQAYKTVIAAYDREFSAEQCSGFCRALSGFAGDQVERALDEWQRNVTPDFDGRSLGSKLPRPADLRAICLKLQSQSCASARGEFTSCGRCAEGWMESRDAKGNRRVARCQCWQTWRATQPAREITPQRTTRTRRAGLEQVAFPQLSTGVHAHAN